MASCPSRGSNLGRSERQSLLCHGQSGIKASFDAPVVLERRARHRLGLNGDHAEELFVLANVRDFAGDVELRGEG